MSPTWRAPHRSDKLALIKLFIQRSIENGSNLWRVHIYLLYTFDKYLSGFVATVQTESQNISDFSTHFNKHRAWNSNFILEKCETCILYGLITRRAIWMKCDAVFNSENSFPVLLVKHGLKLRKFVPSNFYIRIISNNLKTIEWVFLKWLPQILSVNSN